MFGVLAAAWPVAGRHWCLGTSRPRPGAALRRGHGPQRKATAAALRSWGWLPAGTGTCHADSSPGAQARVSRFL